MSHGLNKKYNHKNIKLINTTSTRALIKFVPSDVNNIDLNNWGV